MAGLDDLLVLMRGLRTTSTPENNLSRARDELFSALTKIENEEQNILKGINAKLGPYSFYVTTSSKDDAVKCVIRIGHRLMEKIDREIGEGSLLMIGKDV